MMNDEKLDALRLIKIPVGISLALAAFPIGVSVWRSLRKDAKERVGSLGTAAAGA